MMLNATMAEPVAQICNLLYRGFSIRKASAFPASPDCPSSAECNSAIQQITNLRYGVMRRLLEH